MQHSNRPFIFEIKYYLIPLLLFVTLATVIFPFFQYCFGPDDFSYISIAQRYINCDYETAINGYWSPLNIWVLALWVKVSGMAILPASYVVNCVSFSVLLLMTIRLSKEFVSSNMERFGLGITLAIFCALCIPISHFGDAMSCGLLLICLAILFNKEFIHKPLLWLAWGFFAAMAYYSKAYSFYILPLTLVISLFFLLRKEDALSFKKWLLIFSVSVGFMLLLSFPWVYLLHQKYGIWAISTAGKVNTDWGLVGYMYFGDPHLTLVPPAYPDGLTCWEDPWIHHGNTLSPFGSVHSLIKQLSRILMNSLKWIGVTSSFSPLYFPIWLANVVYLVKGKDKRYFNSKLALLIIALLIYPMGYLMFSLVKRYLLFTVPLLMIAGLYLSKQFIAPYLKTRNYNLFLMFYFFLWLPGSIDEMKGMFNDGKSEYEIAQKIKKLSIHGSFLSNTYENYPAAFRLSWHTGNPFYIHFGDSWKTQELVNDADFRQVQYYYYFYKGTNDDYQLLDMNGKPYPEVSQGRLEGLKIFKLR